MTLHIREAGPDDAAALQAIYARCIEAAEWLPEAARRLPLLSEVSRGERQWLAADTPDGRVLGFASVYMPEAFIHHLYVSADARGRGVGAALLDALRQAAALPRPWRLKCVLRNAAALRFYTSRGWHEESHGESEHGAYAVLRFDDQEAGA